MVLKRMPFVLFFVLALVSRGLCAEEEEWDDVLTLEDPDGITVTGTREEAPQQRKLIEKEQIERIAAPDIPTLLEEALDLNITRHGAYGNSSDIILRGFDTERIAVLIDGVPANSPMSGDFDFNSLDINAIESIEVIYGGSDAKYNVTGALGGVINIVTVKDKKPGWNAGAALSNTSYLPGGYSDWDGTKHGPQWQDLGDTQNAAFSLSWGGERISWSVNLFGNRAGNHYLYLDSFLGKIRRKQFNEIWDLGSSGMFILKTGLSKLMLNASVYHGNKNIPITGFSSLIGDQRDMAVRSSLMFDMPRAFRDDLAMEASVSYNGGRTDYNRIGMRPAKHDQHSVSAINRWTWYPSDKLTARMGWDYRYIYIDSTGTGSEYRHDGGVYLAPEFRPTKSFLFIPSVKVVSDLSNMVAVPKLNLTWRAAEFFTLKNNYFRSFKFPDFEDLYWSDPVSQGNPELRPEDGWGADLTGEYSGTIFNLDTTFFAQWTKDSIHWHKGPGGYWEPENIGEAAFFGLDGKAAFPLEVSFGPVNKITPSLSYQFILSYLLSYDYTWADKKRIPYLPMHTIGFSVDVAWESGSLLFSGHYESLRYYSVTNMIELEPYCLLTLNLNQKFGDFTFFTVLRNLLNQSYESYNRYPMPGLSITLGLRFKHSFLR
jgi:vitamin B12 transporter